VERFGAGVGVLRTPKGLLETLMVPGSQTSRRHCQQGKGDKHRANERKHESGEGGGVDRAALRRRGPITRQRVEAVAVPALHMFAGHRVSSPASGQKTMGLRRLLCRLARLPPAEP
jgi:hypothetical protein